MPTYIIGEEDEPLIMPKRLFMQDVVGKVDFVAPVICTGDGLPRDTISLSIMGTGVHFKELRTSGGIAFQDGTDCIVDKGEIGRDATSSVIVRQSTVILNNVKTAQDGEVGVFGGVNQPTHLTLKDCLIGGSIREDGDLSHNQDIVLEGKTVIEGRFRWGGHITKGRLIIRKTPSGIPEILDTQLYIGNRAFASLPPLVSLPPGQVLEPEIRGAELFIEHCDVPSYIPSK